MSVPSGVVVVGAAGRMGSHACEVIEHAAGFALAARVESHDDLAAVLIESDAVLGLDLTRAGLGEDHALLMLRSGVRPIVGTSGVDAEAAARLDGTARALGLGGLVVPNFSLGMALLQEAAARIASCYPAAEIVELHHADKLDSPSGTAVETARIVDDARAGGQGAPPVGPGREHLSSGTQVHAIRLPGLVAHQEILFGGEGEVLRLRHDASSRAAYTRGLLLALGYAQTAVGVAYGLRAALG